MSPLLKGVDVSILALIEYYTLQHTATRSGIDRMLQRHPNLTTRQ